MTRAPKNLSFDRRALLAAAAAGSVGVQASALGQQATSPAGPIISIADFGAREGSTDNKVAIESAISAALVQNHTIEIPPGTFQYSTLDFGRNDAPHPIRLTIGGTGTLRSVVAGASIISSKGPFYDLVLNGVRFESQPGAGTTLIDGDAFRRLIFTPGTQIEGFDYVLSARKYLQTVRMIGAIVRGGHGSVIKAPMAYDCTFAHNIIEFVTDGIVIDGGNDPASHTCRILHNVIEGLGGRAIVMGSCLATTISGNYFENNTGGDIFLNKGTAPHKGLTVTDNSIQMSKSRISEGAYGIVWGSATALPVRGGGNFCTGNLHDTAGVTALIDMTGDYSQADLYSGYSVESDPGRAPVGRAVYSDGLAQHISWFDRYLSFDPHAGEIRFGGKHRSRVKNREEPPVIAFGTSSPDRAPDNFDRKCWARGSVVFNAEPLATTCFAWICTRAGEPGEWMELSSQP